MPSVSNVLRTNTGTDFFTYSEFQLFQTQANGPKPRVVKHQFVEKGSQIWSDNKEPSEGSYAALLDGKNDTFFPLYLVAKQQQGAQLDVQV